MSKVASARAAQNRTIAAAVPFTLRQVASTTYDQGEVSCGLLMHFHAAAESLWTGNTEASQWKLAVTESETNLFEECDRDTAECREFAVSLASSARDVTTSKVIPGERFECGGMNEADLRAFFGMFDAVRNRMRAAGLEV